MVVEAASVTQLGVMAVSDGLLGRVRSLFTEESSVYPARELGAEGFQRYEDAVDAFEQDDGPLLRVRPPRENEGINAGIDVLETIHDPNPQRVGVPDNVLSRLLRVHKLSAVTTNPEEHAHEIWYEDGQIQFFYRPESRVSGDQFRRQLRNSYKNADVQTASQPFPEVERGDYVAAADLSLKRPFFYPIKSQLTDSHGGEEFERDPYADITSDMVVEEDTTSSGERVTANDCTVLIQTVFEAARDIWSQHGPWGKDVDKIAHRVKEGRIKGNPLTGYDIMDAGSKDRTAAKIIEKQRGMKGYYVTVRVVAISPYQEIAERRVRTIATDMEKYYNSFTEQGLSPSPIDPDRVVDVLTDVVQRTHTVSLSDRLSEDKFLQPVGALGGLAHLPNAEINTPSVDWAKQEAGAGVPAGSTQYEEVRGEDTSEDDNLEWETTDGDTTTPPENQPSTASETPWDSAGRRGEPDREPVDGDPERGD